MADTFHDRQARGRTRTGWLDARHTFSFGSFNDPLRMGFRALRVINEDLIAGGSGFAEHGHDHFEILTVLLSGTLLHEDSAGHHGRLHAGDVQLISTGTGIRHSERNGSADEPAHLFQIWLHGNADQEPPRWQLLEGALGEPAAPASATASVRRIAGPAGADDALLLRAPVNVWAVQAPASATQQHTIADGRFGWLQVLSGVVHMRADGDAEPLELRGGDALQLERVRELQASAYTDARWLWFDLA
jgi:hypothetical protein